MWIYIIEFNEFSVLLHKLNSPATPYHTMLFSSHFIHQTKQARERKRERGIVDMIMKVQCFAKHFFYERTKNISSLYKIICSLVSPFHTL